MKNPLLGPSPRPNPAQPDRTDQEIIADELASIARITHKLNLMRELQRGASMRASRRITTARPLLAGQFPRPNGARYE